MTVPRGECRSCKAPMLWALTPKGERTCFDPEPTAQGTNLLLQPSGFGGELLAIVLSGKALEVARSGGVRLWMSHWATCEHRKEWRERTDAKRAREAGGE